MYRSALRAVRSSRRVFLSGALMAGASVLAACGSAAPPTAEPAASTPAKPAASGAASPQAAKPAAAATGQKILSMWHGWTQKERIEALAKMADAFTKERSGVAPQLEVVPWDRQEAKWISNWAAGTMPDVIMQRYEEAPPMVQAGSIEAVDDLMKELGGANTFFTAPLEQVKVDGRYVGIPWYTFSRIVYYRKDLLDEKGLKAPTTWQELDQVASALSAPNGRVGFGTALAEASAVRQYLVFWQRGNGLDFFDEKGNVTLNRPEAIEAVKAAADLARKVGGQNAAGRTGDEATQAFLTDKSVFTIDWPAMLQWIVKQAPQLIGKVDVMNFPKNKVEPAPLAFTAIFVRGAKSRVADEANSFIKFLMKDENQIAGLHAVAGIQPVTKSVAGSPRFWENDVLKAMRPQMEKHIEFAGKAQREGFTFSRFPSNSIALNSSTLIDMMGTILLNNTPVEQAVADASKKLQGIVDEQRKK